MISSSNYLRSNEQSFLPLNKYGLSDDGPGRLACLAGLIARVLTTTNHKNREITPCSPQ